MACGVLFEKSARRVELKAVPPHHFSSSSCRQFKKTRGSVPVRCRAAFLFSESPQLRSFIWRLSLLLRTNTVVNQL